MSNEERAPGDVAEVRYKNFSTALGELPIAIVNRIERERWGVLQGTHAGLPTLLTHVARVAGVTWEAIEVLALTKRHGELLPSRLSVAIAPLERTLLDALMTVVFIVEEPNERIEWYYRSGWREAAEVHALFVAEFRQNPVWVPWLAEHQAWVDSHNSDFAITDEERADPKLATKRWGKPGYWPNPGKMKAIASGPSGEFLRLLHAWLYGQLSGDSHLSYMGLVRRGGVLQTQHDGSTRDQFRASMTLSAMAIHLALLSEIIAAAALPYEAKRAIRIWDELKVTFTGDMLWSKRYAALLVGVG